MRSAIAVAVMAMVAAGPGHALDTPNGRKLFKQHCAVCHVVRDDGRSSFGPNLRGVIGRSVGAVADYPYSGALAGSGLVWDAVTLEAWIADPAGLVPGTAMKFRGLADHDERVAIIEYLTKASE